MSQLPSAKTPDFQQPDGSMPVAVTSFPSQTIAVGLRPSAPDPSGQPSVAFFELIRRGTRALDYNNYEAFVQAALCGTAPSTGNQDLNDQLKNLDLPLGCFSGMRAYEYVRDVTDIFIMSQAAVVWPDCPPPKPNGTLGNTVSAPEFRFTDEEAADASRRFSDAGGLTKEKLNAVGKDVRSDPSLHQGIVMQTGDSSTFDAPLNTLPFLLAVRRNLSGVGIKNGVAGDADCSGLLRCRIQCPLLIELIWSYWMEQSMLVQAVAAIALRFQNRRFGVSDPLSRMEVTHLRPMTNLLWGYIQRETDRLSVQRRALEYQHAYGLVISGRAVPQAAPADPRPRFLEAFHALLREADRFYRIQANTTFRPDAFRVLNSVKELHLILAEGMHNQYGDLPSTARAEMLMQQFLLARPEMRDFLGGRAGVPYPQSWMPHLETMRQVFGWADASVRYYYELATFGEQLLLSVRFWHWSAINDQQAAAAWLAFWRPEIQSYIHAYRAVTGVDLSIEEVRPTEPAALSTQPSDLIMRRRAMSAAALA